jgi:hypothetical protein
LKQVVPMRAEALLVVACACAGVAIATPASAEEPLRLSWRAPAECPSADAVRGAALRNARGARGAPLEADAVVERGERWTVTLRTRRGASIGERRLDAASCAALADATAVILALALVPPGEAVADPMPSPAAAPPAPPDANAEPSAARPPVETPAPAPASARAGAARPTEDRSREADRTARAADARPSLAIGAWGASDALTLPAVAVGGGGSIAWTPRRFRLEAGAAAWTAQSGTVADSPAGARFAMTTASASACLSVIGGAIDVAPCAGTSATFVSARGFGATNNYEASARWMSADGGILARLPLASWISVRARVDALVPLARPTFAVEGEGTVHRPPPLGVRAALGAEITFL